MNAEEFAGFWTSQGYKVIKSRSCQWYNTEPFVYLSIPLHRVVTPDRKELLQLAFGGPALVVRYLSPAEESKCNGGLYVVSDKNYDIPSLSEKARNRTRRALRYCKVERIEFSDLAYGGFEIDRQTYIRQQRDPNTLSFKKWERYCDAAEKTEGFEAWGAFVEGKLAAYVVCALVEDCYHLLRQGSATDFLDFCPNNALTFSVTQQAIARPDVNYVSTGLKSVEDTAGLNRYKEGMGYTLRPLQDNCFINPVVSALSNIGGAKVIHKLHERNPGADYWRKAERIMNIVKERKETGNGE